ncbi:MAG: alpha/beta fold hydrolase [Armatimonadetes bacterium]|nr:alpha/beta fold hydrolase [Armatimonadota bacterium]
MFTLTRYTIAVSDAVLSAVLYQPQRPRRKGCVLLTHGLTASRSGMDLLAAYLAGKGLPCVTHDLRGHVLGASTGRLESVQDAVDDLLILCRWRLRESGEAPLALVGHSLGGLLSIAAAARCANVCAVACLASSADPDRSFQGPAGDALLRQRGGYLDGAPALELLRQAAGLARHADELGAIPALFVAGKTDILVSPESVRALALRVGPHAEYAEVPASHQHLPDHARGLVGGWLLSRVG